MIQLVYYYCRYYYPSAGFVFLFMKGGARRMDGRGSPQAAEFRM